MGPDAFLHFLDKLLPERCKICIDGLQAVVLVSQCGIKRCTLAAKSTKYPATRGEELRLEIDYLRKAGIQFF
jgi:hypothetical protein